MKRLFVTGLLFVFMAVVPVVSSFSANLPSGYTELEYIESSGTQYIDTGYKPKTGDKIRIVYQYNSLYGGDDGRDATSIFGCTDAASATTAYNGVARVVQGTNTINRIAWGNGTNSVVGNLTYNNATGVWYDLVCDNGVFTINDTQLGTTSVNPFSANFSMYLFARNTGGTAGLITKGKIQIAQIWDNGTLVRDFVPAKNSSGVVGMYDTVGNRFYTNQGTGEFTGGPAKCRNLFDKNAVTANGGGAGVSLSDYIPVVAGQPYYIGDRGSVAVVKEYDADKHYIQTLYLGVNPYTPSANTAFARLNVSNSYLDTFQFEAGSTATDYVPFCANPIKIATTAYNAARFNPVQTDLNSAVATIREIVTKTINQTAAIASLQADKQTRPEDACPAGKKCLLVETEENGVIVPHWFPIIEAPEE